VKKSGFIACIKDDDWALWMIAARKAGDQDPKGVRMPLGEYSVETCRFFTGPGVGRRITPPDGVRGGDVPYIPQDERHSIHEVSGLTIHVVGVAPAYDTGYLEVALSNFRAGGRDYKVLGPIRLRWQIHNP